MVDNVQRRFPSVARSITDIAPGDIRVSVLGTVIDRSEDGMKIVLDDGTGSIDANFESPPPAAVNQLVRVFGRVIPRENGVELQGEIVQDMGTLDIDLAQKLKGLKMQSPIGM